MRRSLSRALFAALFLQQFVLPQGGVNTQLIGQVRTRGTADYSNCWGYVSPGGREYAILGCYTGTQIVDITSDTLKEVAFIPGPSSGWREMKVYQHYAYVVTEGNGAGLQIIDLDSMKLVNTITTTTVPSGHTVSIEGKYLYINGSRYKSGGIVCLDLTNPVSPVVVGEYESQYVHDCVIKNDTIYAAAIYGQGLDIIDATNKANMKRVSITNYPYSGTHNTDLAADKRYVFTTDEINSNPNKNGNLLRVWDRSDVTNLKLVATYVARPQTIVHNIHVKGKYGYLAHYSEGVRILDLSIPEIPVEVASYDTYPGSVNNYVGAWGTFPYFASNKVIISDISGGLYVVRFPGQNGSVKAARAEVTVVDSATGLPIPDVKVSLSGRFDTLFTDAQGKVRFGGTSDTITAVFERSTYSTGYRTERKKVQMVFDSVAKVTIPMTQSASGSLTVTVTNKSTGAPVKNQRVRILNTPVDQPTDAAGTISVPALLGGNTFRVVSSQWGFLPESVSVIITGKASNAASLALTPNGLDDFEIDRGWTVGSPQDSGSTGIWERAKPNAAVVGTDTLQPNKNHTASGSLCFVTGASSAATNYVDYRTTLSSPTFDPTAFATPALRFWAWFNTRSSAKDDTLYVDLSNDGGTQWKTALAISGKQPYWKQFRVEMKNVLTVTASMRVRFVAKDGGTTSVFDAAVDDVEFGDGLPLSMSAEHSVVPSSLRLDQNFPNPFNPSTVIRFSLPNHRSVRLTVFDAVGREVRTLINGPMTPGDHEVPFTADRLASGVYFYTLNVDGAVVTKKLLLEK